MPAVVETPAWVWQKPQSWPVTLTSAWLICASVPAGIPVEEPVAALVAMVELVSPDGRLFLVPATEPPPLVRPWHSWQVLALVTTAWKESDLLQALPVALASVA